MMYARASVIAIPSRVVPNTAPRSASSPKPWRQAMKAHSSAVASSISGYCTEIGARQPRHRPRSASQATTGTFSNQRSPRPQVGQREGGRTTDSFGSAPHRRMQTLRKLPTTAPSTPA
jgi:xanthine/CO dehydrogenase XdhC/CoxF family maturation factor